jgi:hypothetical protein
VIASFSRESGAAQHLFVLQRPTPIVTRVLLTETFLVESVARPAMSDTAHPPDIPPASDTPAATIADEQPASPTSMDKPVVSPVNHATRDPKFGPGVGQAFFSTELGARAPRSLGPIRMPVIARSVQDPSAVVQAATHWQTKYKNQ